ncbi:ABC transporter permease [Pokkaliibacter sp. MBI-7]|uniref:Sugar ABC transporter permease n=1 Tax=Proteobacteria bacterium 228 TaxID=2083153 RepID=A0A2S5KV81_9PROT|nr:MULTISPECIES: ABC transporter permease [Pokkaliibacter]MDH2436295.1 ABC transporter permease [Pokkaliibacter sp. MBI-7]PPC78754.1 sugar ABC transporter permease [Pokkaliibacter plantistimulans]
MLRLERQPQDSRLMAWCSPLLAIALTLAAGALLFAVLGHKPLESLYEFFLGGVKDIYSVGELGVKVTPILLCAVGLVLCYRANVWNIGAEGQFIAGALCAGMAALAGLDIDTPWYAVVIMLAGMLGGMIWAGIAAWLKTHFACNEILTTIMLNYVAYNLLQYGVHGPLKDPQGFNFPESAMFNDNHLLPVILEGTRLHAGILIAAVAVIAVVLLLRYTHLGFKITVLGRDASAATFAGFGSKQLTWIVLLACGGLAGLAGAGEVDGPIGQLTPYISSGYGYAAIIVVFLGRQQPVGAVLASILLGLTYLGGETSQIKLGLPVSLTELFQGMLLFFLLACDLFIGYRLRWIPRVHPA